MSFSASTVYTREKLLNFNKFVTLKKRKFWILIAVCTVLCLASFILDLALGDFDKTIIVAFAVVVLMDVFYFATYFIIPRWTLKKSPALNAEIKFEFYNDNFCVSSVFKHGRESIELRYPTVVKAYETPTVIYLYITKNQAYIVDKTNLEPNSVEDFKIFLKNRNIDVKS